MATVMAPAPAGRPVTAGVATSLTAAILLMAVLVIGGAATIVPSGGAGPIGAARMTATELTWTDEAAERSVARLGAEGLLPDLLPNPTTVLDAAANALRESSVELLDRVLCEMAGGVRNLRGDCTRRHGAGHRPGASFDPGDPAWLRSYARASGVALFVLALLLIRLFVQAGRGGITGEALGASLFHHLPFALLLVVFAPAVGGLLGGLTDALTAEIVDQMVLPEGGSFAAKLGFTGAVAAGLPGGLVVGLVLFLLVLGAGLGLLVQLVLQQLALYLGGVVLPIAFIGLVDPTRRAGALRAPTAWLGVLAAKPALFFLLGCVLALADHAASARTFRDDGIEALFTMLMAVLALLTVAVAPGSLLRWTPLLTAPSDGAGALPAGALVSMTSDVLVQTALSRAGRVADAEGQRAVLPNEGGRGLRDGPPEPRHHGAGVNGRVGRSSERSASSGEWPRAAGHAAAAGSATAGPASGSTAGAGATLGAATALHVARTAAESAHDLGQRVGRMAPDDGGDDQ